MQRAHRRRLRSRMRCWISSGIRMRAVMHSPRRVRSGDNCEPRNRAVVDVVGAGDLPDWFALRASLDRLGLLMRGEFRLAPHLDAARLGPLSAFSCAGADQVTLEL